LIGVPPRIAMVLLLPLLAAACGGGEARQAAAESDAAPAADAAAAAAVSGPESSAPPTAPNAGAPGSTDAAAVPTPAAGEANKREVLLFFQLAEEDALGPESRRILLTDSVIDQAKQIVSELIAGPRQEGLLPTVPDRTTLREVFLDRSGTLYLDLSEEFSDRHPGGSAEEVATVFSIVDSLTYNLPEIKRVRFLIGGEERDTLKEHLDLRRAYLKDMSIVRLPGGK
jgi:hypothetical protein